MKYFEDDLKFEIYNIIFIFNILRIIFKKIVTGSMKRQEDIPLHEEEGGRFNAGLSRR